MMDTDTIVETLYEQWAAYAPCCGRSLDTFFTRDYDNISEEITVQDTARSVACNGCPFAASCMAYAIIPGATDGVWGGWHVSLGEFETSNFSSITLSTLEQWGKYGEDLFHIGTVPPSPLIQEVGDTLALAPNYDSVVAVRSRLEVISEKNIKHIVNEISTTPEEKRTHDYADKLGINYSVLQKISPLIPPQQQVEQQL